MQISNFEQVIEFYVWKKKLLEKFFIRKNTAVSYKDWDFYIDAF